MSSQPGLEDSRDRWRYMIVLSKFILLVIDGGIVKSFGVLIPEMVVRFNSDYKTVAFICGLSSFVYITAPIVNLLMNVMSPRALGMTGALLTSVSLMCAPLTNSVVVLGALLVLTGFGNTSTYLPIITSLNTFFQKSFISANTFTQFGTACGAFVVPVLIERSLEAYGYFGAFLILGAISLHALVPAACIRTPKDQRIPESQSEPDEILLNDHDLAREQVGAEDCDARNEQGRLLRSSEEDPVSKFDNIVTESEQQSSVVQESPAVPGQDERTRFSLKHSLKSFIVVKEPLFALILPAIFLDAYSRCTWMLFLIPHAECLGIDKFQAVLFSTIAGISGIFGKTFYLLLLRFNINPTLILLFSCVPCAISYFMDPISSTFYFLAIMACVQGFAMFLLDCSAPTLLKMSVRKKENTQDAISFYLLVQSTGTIIGATTSGHIFDVTSSCSTLFISLGFILVAMSVNLVIFFYIDRHYRRKEVTG